MNLAGDEVDCQPFWITDQLISVSTQTWQSSCEKVMNGLWIVIIIDKFLAPQREPIYSQTVKSIWECCWNGLGKQCGWYSGSAVFNINLTQAFHSAPSVKDGKEVCVSLGNSPKCCCLTSLVDIGVWYYHGVHTNITQHSQPGGWSDKFWKKL